MLKYDGNYGCDDIARQVILCFTITSISIIGIVPFIFPNSFNSLSFWDKVVQNPIYRLLFVVGMLAVMVIEEIRWRKRYVKKRKQLTLERSKI